MAAVYEYRTMKVAAGRRFSPALRAPASAAVRAAGGSIFGLWSGYIGAGSDEGVLLTHWPDTEILAQVGAGTLGSLDGVAEAHFARLIPTLRPADPVPPTEDGIYAFRWFGLRDPDWARFVDLSGSRLWPWVESHAGCRIVGFWRNMDATFPEVRSLLVTAYPDMAVWQQTRLERPYPPEGADPDLYQSARAAGRQRAEIMEWSVVRILRPVALG